MHATSSRDQLVNSLKGDQAHMSFEEAVKDFPMSYINEYFLNGE